MKTLHLARNIGGVDVTALEKRIQETFNRYKASVTLKVTKSGMVIRVSLLPKSKLPFNQFKEMFGKVDRVIDGNYPDIFENAASWIEVNKEKALELVINYRFEG